MKHQLLKLLRVDNEVEIVGLSKKKQQKYTRPKIIDKIGIMGDKVK